MLAEAVATFQVTTALHVIAVVLAFGVPFGFPLLVAGVARNSTEALPALYRARQFASRALVNPSLVLVLAFGAWTASKLSEWHYFFVQWGIAAIIVIGALEGAIISRGCKQIAEAAGPEAVAAARQRVDLAGYAIIVIVIVTIYLMAVQA